jgi:hypothetical protein
LLGGLDEYVAELMNRSTKPVQIVQRACPEFIEGFNGSRTAADTFKTFQPFNRCARFKTLEKMT